MDKKDRRILYELDKNSRATFQQIGKATGLAPETVRYRINTYQKEQTIKYFLTVIDAAKLGYSYYDIYIKLQNVDEKKKSEFITYFKESPEVTWIANIEGVYDLAMIIMVRNQLELQSLMEEVSQKFSALIMKKSIAINLRGEFLRRDYLTGKQREELGKKKTVLEYSALKETKEIDETDEKICRLIAKDSRISSVEIAKEIGISADTVVLRLRKMQESRIISGYSIILNNEKINQIHFKLVLFLNNISEEKTRKLLSFIRMNNKVIAIIKTLAEWDYEIDLELESINQLKEFTMALTNQFSDIIRDYSTIRILDMPKYNFYP